MAPRVERAAMNRYEIGTARAESAERASLIAESEGDMRQAEELAESAARWREFAIGINPEDVNR